jgi:C-terminal processing protease CtpA/Prc
MEAIRAYSIEPGFSSPVDRWSFAMKKTDWDNESKGIIMSNNNTNVTGDFGMTVYFRAEGDLRVRLVERASPAGQAGIHRSWRVTKINGSSSLTTANSTFIINAVYKSSSTAFTFVKPDGSNVDITLNAGTYQTQPVYLDTIYHYSNKTIGYMVFNSFLGDTAEISNEFQRVISTFTSANVSDVVIDLRYNGGGYVSVQEHLADLLVSASANNNLMFKEEFNDKNTQLNSVINFHKAGALNLDHIYFIVSNSTASASELLINNLKPYMDVRLVGPSDTYGKPVGFYPIPVGDWYIFPISFRSTNKNGVGGYFDGLQVNSKIADGLDKDWGNVTESCLANVIKRVTTGSFSGRSATVFTDLPDEVKNSNYKLDEPLFKGSIGNTIVIK